MTPQNTDVLREVLRLLIRDAAEIAAA